MKNKYIKNLRWYIAALLLLVTMINYFDRQALSIAQVVIKNQFHMTNADYGHICSLFLLSYALAQPFVGRVIDKLGTKKGLSLALIWWSIASVGHSFVSTVRGFATMRFTLGIGESGSFPACIKAVGEWFPAKERALATGIFNIGAGVGGFIAPLVITRLIMHFGWRSAFIFTGVVGGLWLIPWLLIAKKPEEHPRLDPKELAYIKEGQPIQNDTEASVEEEESKGKSVVVDALSRTDLWILMAGRFLTDPVWMFFSMWIPIYFNAAYGFDLNKIAMFTWLPFVSASVGSYFGGWVSSKFVKNGYPVLKARKISMCICAAFMPLVIIAVHIGSWKAGLICLSFGTFGHQAWSASMMTLPSDLYPKRMTAFCYGIASMMGSFGSALSQWGVGSVIDAVGYLPVITVAGLLHPIAAMLVVFFVKPKQKTVNI